MEWSRGLHHDDSGASPMRVHTTARSGYAHHTYTHLVNGAREVASPLRGPLLHDSPQRLLSEPPPLLEAPPAFAGRQVSGLASTSQPIAHAHTHTHATPLPSNARRERRGRARGDRSTSSVPSLRRSLDDSDSSDDEDWQEEADASVTSHTHSHPRSSSVGILSALGDDHEGGSEDDWFLDELEFGRITRKEVQELLAEANAPLPDLPSLDQLARDDLAGGVRQRFGANSHYAAAKARAIAGRFVEDVAEEQHDDGQFSLRFPSPARRSSKRARTQHAPAPVVAQLVDLPPAAASHLQIAEPTPAMTVEPDDGEFIDLDAPHASAVHARQDTSHTDQRSVHFQLSHEWPATSHADDETSHVDAPVPRKRGRKKGSVLGSTEVSERTKRWRAAQQMKRLRDACLHLHQSDAGLEDAATTRDPQTDPTAAEALDTTLEIAVEVQAAHGSLATAAAWLQTLTRLPPAPPAHVGEEQHYILLGSDPEYIGGSSIDDARTHAVAQLPHRPLLRVGARLQDRLRQHHGGQATNTTAATATISAETAEHDLALAFDAWPSGSAAELPLDDEEFIDLDLEPEVDAMTEFHPAMTIAAPHPIHSSAATTRCKLRIARNLRLHEASLLRRSPLHLVHCGTPHGSSTGPEAALRAIAAALQPVPRLHAHHLSPAPCHFTYFDASTYLQLVHALQRHVHLLLRGIVLLSSSRGETASPFESTEHTLLPRLLRMLADMSELQRVAAAMRGAHVAAAFDAPPADVQSEFIDLDAPESTASRGSEPHDSSLTASLTRRPLRCFPAYANKPGVPLTRLAHRLAQSAYDAHGCWPFLAPSDEELFISVFNVTLLRDGHAALLLQYLDEYAMLRSARQRGAMLDLRALRDAPNLALTAIVGDVMGSDAADAMLRYEEHVCTRRAGVEAALSGDNLDTDADLQRLTSTDAWSSVLQHTAAIAEHASDVRMMLQAGMSPWLACIFAWLDSKHPDERRVHPTCLPTDVTPFPLRMHAEEELSGLLDDGEDEPDAAQSVWLPIMTGVHRRPTAMIRLEDAIVELGLHRFTLNGLDAIQRLLLPHRTAEALRNRRRNLSRRKHRRGANGTLAEVGIVDTPEAMQQAHRLLHALTSAWGATPRAVDFICAAVMPHIGPQRASRMLEEVAPVEAQHASSHYDFHS